MAFGGENAESYYDEGLTASMKGNLETAVRHFEKAVALDRTMTAAYHQLAKCYMRMGQGERAVEILERVVADRPRQAPARIDLGYALLSIGDMRKARDQFAQVAARHPGSARANLGLARVAFQEGNWQGAAQLAQAAQNQGEANFATLFLLGRAAKLSGQSALAQQALEKADKLIERSIELNPSQPEGYYLRGEVSSAREDYAEALKHYLAAADRAETGKNYTAYGESFTRLDVLAKQGWTYHRLGNIERAREVGRRICAVQPDHAAGQALKSL